jgi:hypothetical protein
MQDFIDAASAVASATAPDRNGRLQRYGERAAANLQRRGETLCVVEATSGGLVTASLLANPGASRFLVGGTSPHPDQLVPSLSSPFGVLQV